MSLYTEIQKVTQIPQSDEKPLFIRKKDQNEFRRCQKIKKPKTPPNFNLYDLEDMGNANEAHNNRHGEFYFHEHEIASSIREANCGINYSNENLEERWKNRQIVACLSSNTKTLGNDKKSTDDEESVLKKCRLNKNAVIRGLLKNRTISVGDLQIPTDCTSTIHNNSTNVQDENDSTKSNLKEGNTMTLVQCPDDPEVLTLPLQVHGTIDESKHINIDFTVPHIGTKKRVTPRQFFIDMDDSDLDFVKRNAKKK